ncbi:MAG: hypothetical protein KDB07_10340, partial [Planctomycetes bacterium]|nr:hypothetical protein [Planctomycetota bacterium]
DLDDDDKDKKKEVPPPDYSKVKNKLDLAKVELIYTLEQLDDEFEFNVVVYDTKHDYLISGMEKLYKATSSTKKKFIAEIKKLQTAGATNIHGSLVRAFKTNRGAMTKGDPSLAKEGFDSGAETIFFLTDGAACFCDESTAQDASGMGNGPFASGEKLFPDIVRINTFRKVVINTVGIGPHDRGLLSALAGSSGGIYKDLSGNGGEIR